MLYLFNPITLLLVFIIYAKTNNKYVMYVGAVIDFIVNITWFSLIFLDVPKEYLLTKRVERLKQNLGWRGKLANILCVLLNKIQPEHCKG
jgi:archaellum biogenesis protein FlaJ (TadC family)